MNKLYISLFLLICGYANAQVKIGDNVTTIDSSSLLELESTTKGLLIPRLTQSQRNAIALPATGLMVYQTDNTPGFYYYNGSAWTSIGVGSFTETDPKVGSLTTNYLPKWGGTSLSNGLLYDNGTNIGIGTTSPSDKLHIVGNMRIDAGKLDFKNTGQSVFIGENAGLNDDLTNNQNAFVGYNTGNLNTTGSQNNALGSNALANNTTGNYNNAIGVSALMSNTTGIGNNAVGDEALKSNTTGSYNIAIGYLTLNQNTTGLANCALGYQALKKNTTGQYNVSLGSWTSFNNLAGNNNTTVGYSAGYGTLGSGNVFLGYNVGFNETGSNKLYIDNTSTADPLLYGDFSSDLLRINGTLNINNAYSLPTIAGTANYVLQTDGAGTTSWVNPATLSLAETDPKVGSLTTNYLPKWGGTSLSNGLLYDNGTNIGIGTATPTEKLEVSGKTKTTNFQMTTGATNGYLLKSDASGNATWTAPTAGTLIQDADANTKIEVEQSANEDKIRFTLGGTEYYKMNKGTLEFNSTGGSVYIGNAAGLTDNYSQLTYNVGIGANALQKATATGAAGNTAIGRKALQNLTTGYNNVAIGIAAMVYGNGNFNTAVGSYSGNSSNASGSGSYNVSIGNEAGSAVSGSNNTFVGKSAGMNNTLGNNNLMLGLYSGELITTGSSNIFIGSNAGALATAATSNQLYIENSNSTTPLIWGDFANDYVNINGNLGINNNTPTEKLDVVGKTKTTNFQMTSGASNGFILQSDASGNGSWANPTSLSIVESDPKVGSLTTNYLPKWNGTSLTNGLLYDNGTNIGIGTTSPSTKFHLVGDATIAGTVNFNNSWNVQTGSDFWLEKNGTRHLTVYGSDGSTGIATSTPKSTLDINGSLGMKIMSGRTAGTNNPDSSASIWQYTTGSGTITLPSANTYPNRNFVIINATGATRSITTYKDFSSTNQSSINTGTSLWLVSDGNDWIQIK